MKKSELQQIINEEIRKVLNENLDWRDDIIYDNLIEIDHEQLISNMLSAVEENPSITLFDFVKQYEFGEDED